MHFLANNISCCIFPYQWISNFFPLGWGKKSYNDSFVAWLLHIAETSQRRLPIRVTPGLPREELYGLHVSSRVDPPPLDWPCLSFVLQCKQLHLCFCKWLLGKYMHWILLCQYCLLCRDLTGYTCWLQKLHPFFGSYGSSTCMEGILVSVIFSLPPQNSVLQTYTCTYCTWGGPWPVGMAFQGLRGLWQNGQNWHDHWQGNGLWPQEPKFRGCKTMPVS